MPEKAKMNHKRVSIVNASNLKERLEELEIKRDKALIASVDAVNIHPSIKLSTIRKAVIFFSIKLTASTKKTIKLFLEIIHFGMSSTLIDFNREYYKYNVREKE